MKKMEIHTFFVFVCVDRYRPKCVCACILCTCMCVMSQCVTGFRLSPSLHPDSSVKQGLI